MVQSFCFSLDLHLAKLLSELNLCMTLVSSDHDLVMLIFQVLCLLPLQQTRLIRVSINSELALGLSPHKLFDEGVN